MAEEIEKDVAAEKAALVKENDPVPYFKIGPQTFHSGIGSHEPDSIIPWEVPEGWNVERWGKHYASRPPSITWTPMNAAARKLFDAQVARVKMLTSPKPPPRDEKFERLMEAHQKQAEQNAKLIELLTESLLKKK
jgi:hypothetical protein